MITTSRFPHARFLMQSDGVRITKSIRQKDRRVTYYPSLRRLGLACMGAAGVSVLAIVAAWVIHV